MRAVLLTLLALGVGAGPCEAQDKVTWITERFEPYYILEGKLKGQGAADRLLALIQKEMPDLQHETVFLPILRIRESLKKQEHAVCISFLKDKTLADHVQYSAATMLVPALEVTMRREDWETRWQKAPSISLAELMRQGGVTGVAEGRRYGLRFDALLADKEAVGKNVYARAGNHYAGLAEMVALKRIDATIGYSAELRYAQRMNPALESLVSLPAIENTQALYAYTVIPKGAWGDEFRKRLDKVLTKIRATPPYKQALTDWFGSTPAWETEYRERLLTGKMDGPSAGL